MNIFDNLEIAFKSKTIKDLRRARFLFSFIDKEWIVKSGKLILNFFLFFKICPAIFIRPVFKHFCGGVSIEKSKPVINKLGKYNVKSILDYSVEGKETESDFKHAMNETLKSIRFASENKNIPFAVFKPTALTNSNLLKKITSKKGLTKREQVEKENFLARIDRLCLTTAEHNMMILIDAEDFKFQGAIDEVTEAMMKKYNTQQAIVFHTLQMYRKDRLKYLYKIYEDAKKNNYIAGIKFVRGAYMEKERALARENGSPDPIHENKTDTDHHYNEGLRFAVSKLDKISIFNGTHNEKSCSLLVDLMDKYNIAKSDKRIYFAQLFGMSDHISFNLASLGYNVAKYLPYGPVKHVMPYLIRRAEENTSIKGQSGRELTMIIKELKRRKSN